MKNFAIIALVLCIAFGLCACRMGSNNESTPETSTQPQTTVPTTPATDPTIINPTITDPTIAPNVPDPSVDDNHLVDPTGGEENIPDVRGRLN